MIGDDIVITVVDIRGDKVRLGVAAPEDVRVDRREVRERIDQENREARARPAPPAPPGACPHCGGGGCRVCGGSGRA